MRCSTRRSLRFALGSAWACSALALGCSAPDPITSCEPVGKLRPVCGFQNPEDLAALPGGSWLLVSQFAKADGGHGSLVAFDRASGERRALYPAGGAHEPGGDLGADCAAEPDPERFSPHGIDLSADGTRLLVVNHGSREAVEMFDVRRTDEGAPRLVWRGCVASPEGDMFNDVAWHPDGGFVATRFIDVPPGYGSQLRLLVGADTGWLVHYTPAAGYRRVPGSEGSAPNGIAVSADGRTLFATLWGSQELLRIGLDGSDPRRVPLPHRGDNMSRARDGRWLVTGQEDALVTLLSCSTATAGVCALGFSVVAVDPTTLEVEMLLDHRPATVAGAGSVALDLDDALWVGAFAGDRILEVTR